ncbi:MAG: metallophosphoesterase [Opitutaceae bacterium]|nr:metallophosphoesterase [Opitutaceae bacterium]MBP9913160.1 metallophosphoesterase [Opitutaceae bacterium]
MISWRFAHINDTQPGSPRSFRFRPAFLENEATAYAQIQQLQPELLLVGGDLTRDGVLHEFELIEAKARLDALGLRYHAIPGNMDAGNKIAPTQGPYPDRDDIACNLTSAHLDRFNRIFGSVPWTFSHRGVRFTGFYEAVAGSGLPAENHLWEFLARLAALPAMHQHVVVTHYPLFIETPDERSWEIGDPATYHAWYFGVDAPVRQKLLRLLKAAGVTTMISGHIHCRRPPQIFEGITFHKTPATCFGQWPDRWSDGDTALGFTLFTVNADGIRAEFVPLERIALDAGGYGPGGHPRPEQRDYGLAWVKDGKPL